VKLFVFLLFVLSTLIFSQDYKGERNSIADSKKIIQIDNLEKVTILDKENEKLFYIFYDESGVTNQIHMVVYKKGYAEVSFSNFTLRGNEIKLFYPKRGEKSRVEIFERKDGSRIIKIYVLQSQIG
jgi:hypothetical protein